MSLYKKEYLRCLNLYHKIKMGQIGGDATNRLLVFDCREDDVVKSEIDLVGEYDLSPITTLFEEGSKITVDFHNVIDVEDYEAINNNLTKTKLDSIKALGITPLVVSWISNAYGDDNRNLVGFRELVDAGKLKGHIVVVWQSKRNKVMTTQMKQKLALAIGAFAHVDDKVDHLVKSIYEETVGFKRIGYGMHFIDESTIERERMRRSISEFKESIPEGKFFSVKNWDSLLELLPRIS